MKISKSHFLKSFLGFTFIAFASSSFGQMRFLNYKSTSVGDDGKVTFQYRNDKAKKVFVDVQFAGKQEMHKDEKTGIWKVTLGPCAPDMYPYHFEVDGISVMDPQCEQYFPNEGFKNSILEVPAKDGSLPHDIRNGIAHGCMNYVNYWSESLQYTNNAVVYLPPSYYKDKAKRYPVFYLISGTTDTEEVYYKVGRVNHILDNLLAEGKAKEMIVVLSYGNPNKLMPQMPANGMPVTGVGNDIFSNDIVNDLMPYIESHYRTINDSDHRAIGGFSRGGNQGLSVGLHNLDKFSYLCSYSSFTSTDIPNVYKKATNKKLHLFWLGVGTDDFLYGNSRDYMEFLDKKGIRSVKEYTTDKFGHTWMNAKYFLYKTLQLLFNPEASAEAMRNAQPARPKTGNEQQLTLDVMARLFPKQIVSPEYSGNSVTYRFKAEDAKEVSFDSELTNEPKKMEKDDDGIWSISIPDAAQTTFRYCFIVDGMKVADPVNMYLSPDRGVKYSVSMARWNDLGKAEHGVVQYNYEKDNALYIPAGYMNEDVMTKLDGEMISLIPGKDDTVESWFKVGRADDIADRLLAEGKIKPTWIYVGKNPLERSRVLRADDFSTWKDRSAALEAILKGEKVVPLVDAEAFKATIDGKQTNLYTISNGVVTAQITNYGGFIVSIASPDKNGNYANIVTHYNKISDYQHFNLGMVGPALGRFANRIAGAQFSLDNKVYTLTKNSGNNILHSGRNGFGKTVWDVVKHDGRTLVLSCVSADGTDGFPGNLTTTLTYSIDSDNGLCIKYEAVTDKPTVVNLSNHAYFNLEGAGADNIWDHILMVNADNITETNSEGIPSGKLLKVENTPYDFRKGCRIGDRQLVTIPNVRLGQKVEIPEGKVFNYDSNYCLNHTSANVEKVATLHSPQSGRTLEVWNDHPGLQVYTGARTAIALESQMYPDSPNHPEFPSTVLRPGETYTHTCIYRVR